MVVTTGVLLRRIIFEINAERKEVTGRNYSAVEYRSPSCDFVSLLPFPAKKNEGGVALKRIKH
jgi:hypothetical protein